MSNAINFGQETSDLYWNGGFINISQAVDRIVGRYDGDDEGLIAAMDAFHAAQHRQRAHHELIGVSERNRWANNDASLRPKRTAYEADGQRRADNRVQGALI